VEKNMKKQPHVLIFYTFFMGLCSSCATNSYLSDESSSGSFSDETALRHSSGQELAFSDARVITANDEAFLSKLSMVEAAATSIDVAYYIFADDYTSSAFARALIDAARRGVRVRVLLDYSSGYSSLDLYSMMQSEGNKGSGSLQVRFYNRPSRNIVMDAAFVSLRCGEIGAGDNCSAEKMNEIEAQFDAETINGLRAADIGVSNLDIYGSGIFLSGLYSKQPELLALAVMQGRELASAETGAPQITIEQLAGLVKIARIYWRARTGNLFERLVARIQLAAISLYAGDVLDPIFEVIAENLPVKRQDLAASLRDWEYVTDYLHQKLLIVDGRGIQLGGRNIEDTYHLRQDQLDSGLRFMDTDVRIDTISGGGSVEDAFERLWNFTQMVAKLDEVRQHAPNELVANHAAFEAANEICHAETADDGCFDREFGKLALEVPAREALHREQMQRNADHFQTVIRPGMRDPAPTSIAIDADAKLYYLENIPFRGKYGEALEGRTFGAENNREAWSGKRIHSVVLNSLESACRTATSASPQRVIINNAYFFPPSNLVDTVSRMLDGRLPCQYVDLILVTNSRESTDLRIVNTFGRHIAFAFSDYLRSIRDTGTGATYRYYEMQPGDGPVRSSLHSKVWIIGDDVIVGSANADVRSYMMDANNAVMIRQAPEMRGQLMSMIDETLADPAKATDMSEFYRSTTRAQIVEEDRRAFRALIDKIGRLSDAQKDEVERRFVGMLDQIYSLTIDGLKGNLDSEEKRARFNRIFKII
jgi:phosphatidylserine/phosphatidylglycerophosphate/cardiolipin synthase-like enzyme